MMIIKYYYYLQSLSRSFRTCTLSRHMCTCAPAIRTYREFIENSLPRQRCQHKIIVSSKSHRRKRQRRLWHRIASMAGHFRWDGATVEEHVSVRWIKTQLPFTDFPMNYSRMQFRKTNYENYRKEKKKIFAKLLRIPHTTSTKASHCSKWAHWNPTHTHGELNAQHAFHRLYTIE